MASLIQPPSFLGRFSPSRELEILVESSCVGGKQHLLGYDARPQHSIGWGKHTINFGDVLGTFESDPSEKIEQTIRKYGSGKGLKIDKE